MKNKKSKNKLKIVLIISLGIFLLLMINSVVAADIYVDNQNGNDNNNGTSWVDAKKSIKNATNTIIANGWVVNIKNGNYTGGNNSDISIIYNMTITGESSKNTIIDANAMYRIFSVNLGISLILENLTFKNGNNPQGGAIYNEGLLNVNGCEFINNTGDYGGAIKNDNGIAILSNSIFLNNHANENGGAIDNNNASITIFNSSFLNNHANENGGVIINSVTGNTTIIKSNFINNSADKDGGVIENNANTFINNSCFINNSASRHGGAIDNWENINLIINGSSFSNNIANSTGLENGYGGVIYNYDSNLLVEFSRFLNNSNNNINNTFDIYNNSGTIIADNNWWGENYNNQTFIPNTRLNFVINNRLVLNISNITVNFNISDIVNISNTIGYNINFINYTNKNTNYSYLIIYLSIKNNNDIIINNINNNF